LSFSNPALSATEAVMSSSVAEGLIKRVAIILDGIGHNVPQEAPGAFTDAILEVGGGLP
jgi:pimeloyl-ACP methyl ester carboxylesterase